jgi:hypothetical protein
MDIPTEFAVTASRQQYAAEQAHIIELAMTRAHALYVHGRRPDLVEEFRQEAAEAYVNLGCALAILSPEVVEPFPQRGNNFRLIETDAGPKGAA